MNLFDYVRPASVAEAVAAASEPGAAYLAAGTNLLDLMKSGRNAARPAGRRHPAAGPRPDRDAARRRHAHRRHGAQRRSRPRSRPSLSALSRRGRGAALRRFAAAAQRGDGRRQSDAAYALRLFLRPRQRLQPARAGRGLRCASAARTAPMRCSAGRDACIATHPSDFCVPLVALDAVVEIEGPAGRREVPLEDFHLLPGTTPERESVLAAGRADHRPAPAGRGCRLPRQQPLSEAARAHLVCLRPGLRGRGAADRRRGDPAARLALGGVAAKPWRARAAEALLVGAAPTREAFARAAEAALADAAPSGDNAFKIELAKRVVKRALLLAAAGTPQRMPALPASAFSSDTGVLSHA